jgi:hypothetical protein
LSELERFENYFRDHAVDQDPNAGAYALAYAVLRLSRSVDGLTKVFAPQGLGTFEGDYFLVRLARRLDELVAIGGQLVQQRGLDPPEAREFLSRRRPAGGGRRKQGD